MAWPDCTNNWRAVLRLAVKADACKSSYAGGLIMMASTFTSPGEKMNAVKQKQEKENLKIAIVAHVSTETQCALHGRWTCQLGKVSSCSFPRYCTSDKQIVEFAYTLKRETGGCRSGFGTWYKQYKGRPHSRLGRASCTAYTASAGAEERPVVLSSPLPSMPPCPTKPCGSHAPPLSTSPPSASPPAQHSTAQHRRCAFSQHLPHL